MFKPEVGLSMLRILVPGRYYAVIVTTRDYDAQTVSVEVAPGLIAAHASPLPCCPLLRCPLSQWRSQKFSIAGALISGFPSYPHNPLLIYLIHYVTKYFSDM